MAQRTARSRTPAAQEVQKSRGRWNGATHVRHCDYSPTLGRFNERDPIGFEAGDSNWYRFVANGPTGKVDPSGLVSVPMTAAQAAAAGWTAKDIAFWFGIPIVAANAMAYHAEITNAAQSVIKTLTGNAALRSTDPIKQHLFCKSRVSEVGHLASMFR